MFAQSNFSFDLLYKSKFLYKHIERYFIGLSYLWIEKIIRIICYSGSLSGLSFGISIVVTKPKKEFCDKETPDLFTEMNLQTLITTPDRKSTRLNSSHVANAYAVICLK